jgi:hypothetical protein
MKMRRANRALTIAFVSAILLQPALAEQPAAHAVADWIKSAVIYEVNPRTSRPATFAASNSVWII